MLTKKDRGQTPKTRSDRKRYNSYYKKSKSENLFFIILIALREYGIFVIPIIPAYMLFYYVVFRGGGKENGLAWLYITLSLAIVAAVLAGFYLRRLFRDYKFRKYSEMKIPYFKGNAWRCPFCSTENKLLSPCKRCGIYPELYRSEKDTLSTPSKKRTRKAQREFDEYVPQFEVK